MKISTLFHILSRQFRIPLLVFTSFCASSFLFNGVRFSAGAGFAVPVAMSLGMPMAQADTITGNMLHTGSAETLRIRVARDGQVLSIQANNDILKCLRRLRPADLVTVQGTVNALRQVLTIDSIDRLGLQELLGAWNSERWEIFEFKTFSQLELYIPSVADTNNGKGKPRRDRHPFAGHTRSLRYAITPDPDEMFSIFMTDNDDVRMGFLKVMPNKLVITVLDPKNGKVAETISLLRMRPQ